MNIKVIVLGKISERFAKEGIQEYEKRLSRYCKVKLVEVKNEAQILKEINGKAYLIEIHTDGHNISSEELSTMISNLGLGGNSDITFIVSDDSLPQVVNDRINFRMAISKMTMDLNILSITLFEQIYRAYRILSNEPYHK